MTDNPSSNPSSDSPEAAGFADVPDMGSLFAQAQQMAERLMEEKAEADDTVLEGEAGGGAVKVEVTGGYEFLSISIKPEAVDPDDVEMLEDLVLAALNNAMAEVADLHAEGLGGMDLGGFGNLLGGAS